MYLYFETFVLYLQGDSIACPSNIYLYAPIKASLTRFLVIHPDGDPLYLCIYSYVNRIYIGIS